MSRPLGAPLNWRNAKQNNNPANFKVEWRGEFAVRSQRVFPGPAPTWIRDYTEYSMAQVSMRDVHGGTRDDVCALWWTVEAYGRDLVREGTEVSPGVFSGGGFDDAFGAGFLPTGIQLSVSQNADHPIFVDVGTGVRFSVLTDQINIKLFVPSRNVRFAQATEPEPVVVLTDEAPTIIDSTTVVTLTCSEGGGPIGNRISTCTRTYAVTDTDVPGPFANTIDGVTTRGGNEGVVAGDFVIPPRSRSVQFSGGADGRISFLDNPINRNSLGRVTFVPAAMASRNFLAPVQIPRNATIISFSAFDPGEIVTATYELEL